MLTYEQIKDKWIMVIDSQPKGDVISSPRLVEQVVRWVEGQYRDFHPRAMKLIEKKKDFIVIAADEPYFLQAYGLIRGHEQKKGTWSDECESQYQSYASSI